MIQEHFQREMRERHLLIWGTRLGTLLEHSGFAFSRPERRVSVRSWAASPLREVVYSSPITKALLAAQFTDVVLPRAHERENILSVTSGLYDCLIVQLSDPERVMHQSRSQSISFTS